MEEPPPRLSSQTNFGLLNANQQSKEMVHSTELEMRRILIACKLPRELQLCWSIYLLC